MLQFNSDFYRMVNKSNNNGFTVIEALIVVGLIGIISVFILVKLDISRQHSQESRTQADLVQARKALAMLLSDTGKWPNGCEPFKKELPPVRLNTIQAGLVKKPVIGDQGDGCKWLEEDLEKWDGPYIDRVIDLWGNSYYLNSDYQPYRNCPNIAEEPSVSVVLSFGPNGQGLNSYDCDDIFLKLK